MVVGLFPHQLTIFLWGWGPGNYLGGIKASYPRAFQDSSSGSPLSDSALFYLVRVPICWVLVLWAA
jgi:hypothetical protein